MNRIYILLGGSNSGKSSVLRGLKRNSNEKNIFIKLSSFQELVEFCNYKKVIQKLKKYIGECESKAQDKDVSNFVIVIAFALRRNKKSELGVDCIVKPLKYLKSMRNYQIRVIHLHRDIIKLRDVDSFIEDNIEVGLILQSKNPVNRRQDNNARMLRRFIFE